MNARTRHITVAIAAGALLLGGAGAAYAQAAPDTQSPLQGVEAGQATLENAVRSLLDAANSDNRPDGANGLESEFPEADPRFVEGPVGGLLKNGPFE